MNGLQILIIDDRTWVREAIRGHILRAWPDAGVDELSSGELTNARRAGKLEQHDVILLAQSLNRVDGTQILLDLRASVPAVPVVVVLDASDEASAAHAFRLGAADVLSRGGLNELSVQAVVREAVRQSRMTPATGVAAAKPAAAPDAEVPGFAIESRISTSALSSVYLARSRALGRRVALKLLRGLGGAADESVARFVREHEVLSRIDHEHVVKIFDVGGARDDLYIAMEYLSGGTLREALGNGPLEESRCIRLTGQICAALDSIHNAGILHRDLKPANVMLRDDGSACLIDFGMAKRLAVEQELTVPGRLYGTPYYMSPEQGQGLAMDLRSDLYSLGIVFYELLTGQKPYVAGTPVALVFKHAHAPLPLLPRGMEHWQDLFNLLLAKRPADRPASAAAVVELLNHCKNS